MAGEERKVKVVITGDNTGLKNATTSSESLLSKLNLKAVAVGTAITVAFTKSISAFKEAEEVQKRLDAVLKATGSSAGVTAKEITNLSTELQKSTKYGDEALTTLQTTLLKFGNIKKDVFEPTTRSIVDMAAALNIDLNSAANMVGRALQDPITGMRALRSAGVQFTEQQKEQVVELLKSNDLLAAQTLILGQLDSKFKGTAESLAKGTGMLTQIAEDFGDLFEQAGEGIFTALEPLVYQFRNFIRYIKESEIVTEALYQAFSLLAGLIKGFTAIFSTFIGLFPKLDSSLKSNISLMDSLSVSLLNFFGYIKSKGYELLAFWEKLKANILDARAALSFDDKAESALRGRAAQARDKAVDYQFQGREALGQGDIAYNEAMAQARERKADNPTENILYGAETERAIVNTGKSKGEEAKAYKTEEEIAKSQDDLAMLEQNNPFVLLTEEQRAAKLEYLNQQREEDLTQKEEFDKILLEQAQKQAEELRKVQQEGLTGQFMDLKNFFTMSKSEREKNKKSTIETEARLYGEINNLAEQAAAHNRTLAISFAVIKTAAGVARALSDYPFPYSVAIGAMVAASGALQISKIKAAKTTGAAQGGIVGGIDTGKDNQMMAVRSGEMIVPPQYVKPLMPTLAGLIKEEDRTGRISENAPSQNSTIVIELKGDAGQFINATLIRDRQAGLI